MQRIKIMMVLMALLLTGGLLFIGLSIQNKNKEYTALENDIVENGKVYVEINIINLALNESTQVSLDKMVTDGYLSSETIQKENCSGFLTIKRTINGYTYTPYIKCNDYETIGD